MTLRYHRRSRMYIQNVHVIIHIMCIPRFHPECLLYESRCTMYLTSQAATLKRRHCRVHRWDTVSCKFPTGSLDEPSIAQHIRRASFRSESKLVYVWLYPDTCDQSVCIPNWEQSLQLIFYTQLNMSGTSYLFSYYGNISKYVFPSFPNANTNWMSVKPSLLRPFGSLLIKGTQLDSFWYAILKRALPVNLTFPLAKIYRRIIYFTFKQANPIFHSSCRTWMVSINII